MPTYFTIKEANQVVNKIRPWIKEIIEIRQVLLEKRPDLLPVLKQIGSNGGSMAASQLVEEFRRIETLATQIQATGAQLKDINSGLVDFLTLREDREVYLCWRYGEESVRYWHEIDAGFSGRQPL